MKDLLLHVFFQGDHHHLIAAAAKLGIDLGEMKAIMDTVQTSKDALKALQNRIDVEENESVPFMSRALALLKQLGAHPTMEQKQKVLDSLNISDLANQVSIGEVLGLGNLLGFSKDDVESALSEIIIFLDSITIADMPALLKDLHGLLVEMGVPNGSLSVSINMLEDKVKDMLMYFYEGVSS